MNSERSVGVLGMHLSSPVLFGTSPPFVLLHLACQPINVYIAVQLLTPYRIALDVPALGFAFWFEFAMGMLTNTGLTYEHLHTRCPQTCSLTHTLARAA